MIKNFTVLFLLLSFFAAGQKNVIDAQLMTFNNHTSQVKIKVVTNMFSPKLLNELSVNSRLLIVQENGKKFPMTVVNVKELTFVDLQGAQRKFINISGDRRSLTELVYDGKIKWHRQFSRNAYNGSIIIDDIFINERNEKVTQGAFTGVKKQLAKLTESKPELITQIESTYLNKEGIIQILKKYEED